MKYPSTQAAPALPQSSIEEISLRYSSRGMTILRQYLREDYCRHTAKRLLSLPRGSVLLTTGFYVAGVAETDGPPGTLCLAAALKKLGFSPTIVTDHICRNLFEMERIPVTYVDVADGRLTYETLLQRYKPVALISVERCGRNRKNDYANMRDVSIAKETASIDTLFELAADHDILTIGIGDGGNEIGMGNLKDMIARQLSLTPCTITVDELIVATTSNWGAYALAACMELFSGKPLLPAYQEIADFLKRIVSLGCVDGVTKKQEPTVDGFSPDVEEEIFQALLNVAKKSGIASPGQRRTS